MDTVLKITDTAHHAQPLRAPEGQGTSKHAPSPKTDVAPLQIKLPRSEIKAIKVAAAQSDKTISDFMLTCFHAYQATRQAANQG